MEAKDKQLQQLQIQVNSLEELLQVHEQASMEQAQKLEAALRDLRKRTQALNSSESALQILETILDSMGDSVAVVDKVGKFLLVNPAAKNTFGEPTTKYFQQWLQQFEFFHADMVTAYSLEEFPLTKAIKGESQKAIEVFVKPNTRHGFWLSISAEPLKGKNGESEGGVAVWRDITESKRIEQDLIHRMKKIEEQHKQIIKQKEAMQEANRQLIEASRHKSEFLASMSHELRTPLNAILGYTGLILAGAKDSLSPDHLENLQNSERSAKTLLELINDILDFSKIEAGAMDFYIEECDVNEILEEVLITAKGLTTAKEEVELKSDIASDLPFIQSDYVKIKQIVTNLLSNAVKFTEKGHCSVACKEKDGKICLVVEDTGRGIPQENLATIFESFKQVDGSIKKRFGGTGLGLSITKNLCDMLGIDISIKSQIDQGTTFTLLLPKEAPKNPSTKQTNAASLLANTSSSALESPTNLPQTSLEQSSPQNFSLPQSPSGFAQVTLTLPSQENTAGYQLNFSLPFSLQKLSADNSPVRTISTPAPDFSVPATEEPKLTLETPSKSKNTQKAVILCFCSEEICSKLTADLANIPLEIYPVQHVSQCIEKARSATIWAIFVEPDVSGFSVLPEIKNEPILKWCPLIMCSTKSEQKEFQLEILEWIRKPVDKNKLMEALIVVSKWEKREILVVDDDKDCRKIYKQLLAEIGYKSHLATNGKEALEYLSGNKLPQAIILDLLMPEINGFQFLEQLQKNKEWQNIPVIISSGKDLSAKEKDFLKKGAQILVNKAETKEIPLHVDALTKYIERVGARSILIIDDNNTNLDVVKKIFQQANFTTYIADSGPKGIELAKEKRPCAILMDLAMPDMDGFEATRKLKAHPLTSDITIVACSAFHMRELKKKAFDAGCEGYITKPIEPSMLVEQTRSYVLISKIKRKLAIKNYIFENEVS